ncbi:MAG: Hint domain-containing protein [Saprospiraceae bacterium]
MLKLLLPLLMLLSFSSISGKDHFTNATSLGVTASHPIYSTTYHDWRLAGELEVGERVLTYKSEATVSSTVKRAGSETVYNLEVKDLHNFLVGDEGVVVHNNCLKEAAEEGVESKLVKEAVGDVIDEVKDEVGAEVREQALKKGRKLTWPEVLAFFKRGNLFNKKGVAKYTNSKCEIHLGNGKRLDTYIPGEKIISRKATDLDQIEESTWRNYCNELITKYKRGTPVKSSKMPGEPPLSGNYFIEVPASNQSAQKLATFRAIAQRDYGIEDIIFLIE